MALARFPTTPPQPRPLPGPGGFNPMQAIMQIIAQLMQVMLSQFQGGGGYQQPYNPFGGAGAYGPQQPSPFNFYGGAGAGGGGYLV
ncbi:MAG: hypothetical protein KF760_32155 [Candidatus Eremiobacteraeota bacterium]|nr:hypothetical protein [Candidatus Eremiobacteraeota bacterium]MCW5871406.1 hypothetical protein [Candidatus Eremiobacteraeota bacterium]